MWSPFDRQWCARAAIVGAARSELDAEAFRKMIRDSLLEFAPKLAQESAALERFLVMVHYVRVDASGDAGWADLKDVMRDDVVRAFYLSVSPSLFGTAGAK